jgi:hypothetical protein
MADDPNPALTAELMAARTVLAPQLRGLSDLLAVTTSSELHRRLAVAFSSRNHRDDLLATALVARDAYMDALNALDADGYPALPNINLTAELLAEVDREAANIGAAVAVFQIPAVVTINTQAVTFTEQAPPTISGP